MSLTDFIEYSDPIILYKNGESSNDYGIKVIKTNILSSPALSVEEFEVPGRDGSLTQINGWEDFVLEVECVLVGKDGRLDYEDMAETARKAKRFLTNGGVSQLYTSEDENFYLRGYYSNKIDIEEISDRFTDVFQVKYTCKPFRYSKNSRDIILNSGDIVNIKYEETKPIIKVIGTGDVTIKINNQSLILKDVDGHIYVDSGIMDAYRITQLQIVPENHKMYSFFPVLKHGDNEISWNNSNFTVEIKWREMSL